MSVLFGVGNPLMDLLVERDAELLARLGAPAGSMNLVDRERQEELLATGGVRDSTAGGSCANTLRGVAWLAGTDDRDAGIRCEYCGAVGSDHYGELFATSLCQAGVEARLATVAVETGTSVIVVTPDFERTMFTHLGACRELTRSHVAGLFPAEIDLLHLAGYMWDTENQTGAATWAIDAARSAGARVSFDLADTFVVSRYRDALLDTLPGRIDLLFGNLEELRRLTDCDGDAAETAALALECAPTVVLKDGAAGCWVAERRAGGARHVAAYAADACDTTGAGDSFAAGYLYGVLIGCDSLESARLANRVAAGIVSVYGCDYRRLDRESVIREARSPGAR